MEMNRHLIALGAALAAVAVLTLSAGASWRPDWSEPVNLGSIINTAYEDNAPAISKDGLTLYFQSNRPGGTGSNNCDIWVAQRQSVHHEWDWPENLGSVVNTESCELSPALSRDEHHLFFGRQPAGEFPDVWVSYRSDVRDDFGWEAPVALGPAINTTDAGENTAEHFESRKHGLSQLYFYRSPGAIGSLDIYVADAFGAARPVIELNTPLTDAGPTLSRDGLEIFFHSNREGTMGQRDLWTSVRPNVFARWSPPVNLGAVNSQSNDTVPALSSDGETLFFASDRPGFGSTDIYMTTRRKH
jgi:hypothetical protein